MNEIGVHEIKLLALEANGYGVFAYGSDKFKAFNEGFIEGYKKALLPSHVPISVERLEALEKCVEALEDIANPMKKIQSDAEKQGAIVNGMMAIQLCKDGNWLSSKAQEALTNLNKQK